jgi:hypothetical protein
MSGKWSMLRILAITAAFLSALASHACADAIDGDWCSPEGLRLSIKGPEITTPDNTTIQGNYKRHEFSYVSPADDTDAGSRIYMNLISEEEMNLYHVGKDDMLDQPVTWRRCKVVS